MIPIVALVGRPNVGKSTLFNRLAGKQLAIVHDEPGVTRDRHYADTHLQGRDLVLVDTGGFDPEDDDPMRQGIARHVNSAIEEADVIVCVLDALTPPTHADETAIALLRRSNKPVVYLANRADNRQAELDATELHRLGIDPLIAGSALHGRGMAKLEAAVVNSLPALQPTEQQQPETQVPRVLLIGRPNAGKSSLLNALSGSERSLVDSRPGTTRDPVDARVSFGGRDYLIIDTAGVRRRSKVKEAVESASVMRAIRGLGRCDVAVLMCDTSEAVAEQDARLLSLAADRGCALVIGLNKMDLLSASERKQAEDKARDVLHFVPWVPVVTLSAKTGRGVSALMKRVGQSYDEYSQRVPTAQLNRFFEEVLERHPPPTKSGRAPRLYYVTQAQSSPPVFVAMCSHPDAIPEAYRRFVTNQLRQAFGFESIPIRLRFKARRRNE